MHIQVSNYYFLNIYKSKYRNLYILYFFLNNLINKKNMVSYNPSLNPLTNKKNNNNLFLSYDLQASTQ